MSTKKIKNLANMLQAGCLKSPKWTIPNLYGILQYYYELVINAYHVLFCFF